ncbi:MAG: twin-arginine translocase TatA/TatE family subunit [Acidobacteriota bacterium]|nr:twin-arginine translocase TatA/TatE family subunit [Acidobacteriota bacterium]
MVLLILESLGSTELLFILAMALVFFGPRKLPQISRSLGKNLAEFRRASEDFKQTWDREVSLEEYNFTADSSNPVVPSKENSILDDPIIDQPLHPPTIEPVAADRVVPRQPVAAESAPAFDTAERQQPEPLGKSDWL